MIIFRELYGGNTTYNIIHEKDKNCLRVYGKLIKQRSAQLPIKYMFGGFGCFGLLERKLGLVNGLRVVAQTNGFPIKVTTSLCFDGLSYERYS